MTNSITKYTKSLSVKILVGIIILPFIFWGMGDVFRGGNQNIIAEIDSNKISTQEFIKFLNRINLSDKEREDLKKTDLLEKVLSEFIGKKIVSLEVENFNIKLSDESLKNLILNNESFMKENKFSRTKYEKFLITNGVTAPNFERSISEQEKRDQLLAFLSSGTSIPEFMTINAFNRENQKKIIEYIDLDKLYNKETKKDEIKKIYDQNKKIFVQTYKNINFAELSPIDLTGQNEYDENFFNKIDKIENDMLDGKPLLSIATENNFNLNKTGEINNKKTNTEGVLNKLIKNEIFEKAYKMKLNAPELFNINEKYYIAEIISENQRDMNFSNKDVQDLITAQIKIKNKLETNSKISKQISAENFDKSKFDEFAKINNLQIKKLSISNLNDANFSKDVIREIFKTKNKEINLINDRTFTKNFIIYTKETEYKKLDKTSQDFIKYEIKARSDLVQEIYRFYDMSINNKYKVEINNKVIERVKNSF